MKIIKYLVFIIISIFSKASPRFENKWIYIASDGNRFAENSKYLYLNNVNKKEGKIEHIWIGASEEVIQELRSNGFSAYYANSIKAKYHLLTAGVAIETHGPQFGRYLSGATIIDTHHGNALKTMGSDKDVERSSGGCVDYIKSRVWHRLVSISYLQVTNNGIPKETFKKARQLTESEILIAPYPRLDPFFKNDSMFKLGVNKQLLSEIQEKNQNRNVVIYAPTWREAFEEKNGKALSNICPDFKYINNLMERTGSILYISTHPREPLEIDYNKYEHISKLETGGDIYPFLRYCDVLITDYSSIFYDFLFADQPICFYAPDLAEYQATRGLYFEYKKHVPGPVSQSTSELIRDLNLALAGNDQYATNRSKRLSEFYIEVNKHPSEDTDKKINEILQ